MLLNALCGSIQMIPTNLLGYNYASLLSIACIAGFEFLQQQE